MGKKSRAPRREEILQEMCALAGGRVNDAVRLAYLAQEQADQIGQLDLMALKEFKRSPAGAVELKLTDRMEVLVKVLELLDREDQETGAGFLRALEQAGRDE